MRAARTPLKVHPAIAIAAIIFCLVILCRLFWPIYAVYGEIVALLALGLGFRYCPPMLRWLARMPVPHRVVFALVLASMVAGHFTFDGRRYFPFIPWEIFSFVREQDPVSCREFIATTVSGKSVRLLAEQLYPSIIQFNPPGDIESSAMTQLIHALARARDRRVPGDPVQRVDLVRMSVKLHPAADDPHPFSWQLLKSYDVSSDRSN